LPRIVANGKVGPMSLNYTTNQVELVEFNLCSLLKMAANPSGLIAGVGENSGLNGPVIVDGQFDVERVVELPRGLFAAGSYWAGAVSRAQAQGRYFNPDVQRSLYTTHQWRPLVDANGALRSNVPAAEALANNVWNYEQQRLGAGRTLFAYLNGIYAAGAEAVELVEIPINDGSGGYAASSRRIMLTMPRAVNGQREPFAAYFERVVRQSLFRGSKEECTWGDFIAFPIPWGATRAVNLLRWFEGDLNCLVRPILERLVERRDKYEAAYEAKATSQRKSVLRAYELKVAIAEGVLAGVGQLGIGCDMVRVLCEQVQICVEVRSIIAAHHGSKCTVCLAYVLDAGKHVCFVDGAKKTVDFVTVFRCDKTRSKNDFKFVFIETRDGHVDLAGNGSFHQQCFMTSCGETIVIDDLGPMYGQLVESDTLFAFKQDASGRVTKIMVPGQPPVSAPPNPFWEVHQEFLKKTLLRECYVDAVQQPELSSFVVSAMAYNTTVDNPAFNYTVDGAADWIGSIDLKRAYANVGHCSYYTGYLGKIHELRRMTEVMPGRNGIYWVDVTHVPLHLDTPVTRGWFVSGCHTSPELCYWGDIGILYDVRAGCIGSDVHFDFNEHPQMMERYSMTRGDPADGIRGYCLSTGVMQSHCLTESYNLHLGSKCGDLFKDMPGVYINAELKTATATFPRWTSLHLCHVIAFIFSYVRISVMKQALAMGGAVMRVCVDGIYYDKRVYSPPVDDAAFNRSWSVKADARFGNAPADQYVCRDIGFNATHLETLSCRTTNGVSETLITGMGGNGKSHLVCTDILVPGNPTKKTRMPADSNRNGGLVRPVLLVPTHAQRTEKLADYPGLVVWTHAKIFNFIGMNSQHPNVVELSSISNVLMFDECSMIPDALRLITKAVFPRHKIIWLGDVGYQCPPVPIDGPHGEKIDRPEFDATAVESRMELTVNYRIKCDHLMNLAQCLRRAIDERKSVVVGSAIARSAIQHITTAGMQALYRKGDFVICRTHDQIAHITNLLCGSFEQYKNSRNKITDVLTGRDERASIIPYQASKLPRGTIMHCHGFTVHATQGQTIKRPRRVFICLTRDMELRVLYTAITRCEYIDQLYYYEGDHSDFSDMVEADEDEDDDEYDEDVTEALAVVSAAVQTSLRAAWRATVSRQ
jgi:hypothetical protein